MSRLILRKQDIPVLRAMISGDLDRIAESIQREDWAELHKSATNLRWDSEGLATLALELQHYVTDAPKPPPKPTSWVSGIGLETYLRGSKG